MYAILLQNSSHFQFCHNSYVIYALLLTISFCQKAVTADLFAFLMHPPLPLPRSKMWKLSMSRFSGKKERKKGLSLTRVWRFVINWGPSSHVGCEASTSPSSTPPTRPPLPNSDPPKFCFVGLPWVGAPIHHPPNPQYHYFYVTQIKSKGLISMCKNVSTLAIFWCKFFPAGPVVLMLVFGQCLHTNMVHCSTFCFVGLTQVGAPILNPPNPRYH